VRRMRLGDILVSASRVGIIMWSSMINMGAGAAEVKI
jgi:hypothetical protein